MIRAPLCRTGRLPVDLGLPSPMLLSRVAFACVCSATVLSGCAYVSTSGPDRGAIQDAAQAERAKAAEGLIQVIDVDDEVARKLVVGQRMQTFAEALGHRPAPAVQVQPGDFLEVTIWEAPPATLFGSSLADTRSAGGGGGARATVIPEQIVPAEGSIAVPFAGRVNAAGRTLRAIEEDIAARLKGSANQPQVIVRFTQQPSATVTMVGDFTSSRRFALTASRETLLDAVAAAGGVRYPVSKVTLQVTRGEQVHAMPLDVVIRDPRQNVRLLPGDVLTAIVQPLTLTVLGATGKNDEMSFEIPGINLGQALARAGGLQDSRADAKGVYVFRFEKADALAWPRQPVVQTPDGRVAVIYRVDLTRPSSLFTIQNFAIRDKDLLYVSNAPAAELQKVLNLVFSVAYPLLSVRQVTQ